MQHRSPLPLVLVFALSGLGLTTLPAEPQWIWLSNDGNKDPKVTFRHTFEAPANVKSAKLQLSCDNTAEAILNGKKIGNTKNWQQPLSVNVAKDLKLGAANEIVVEATNEGSAAGLVARLRVKLNDGSESVLLETNGAWQAATTGSQDWKPAFVLGEYGRPPWNKVLDQPAPESIAAKDITAPAGFRVEKLYNVPRDEEGSWVALTVDAKGRLIAGDQYGSLYRMNVPPAGQTAPLAPEKLELGTAEAPVEIGKAHGLLAAFGSLYVMVNEDGPKNGLYRLTDANGDDRYDTVTKLHTMAGGGEHGLHSMVVSPDGKRIFFNCGNATKLPEGLTQSRDKMGIWNDDHVIPRMWDANGFMRGYHGAGGYVASMNPDGSDLELFCHGFRNEFDICFNDQGELFTYDADMEWDIGAPWYRPTRVNHCVSGADYGWRSGSGKWPDYYADSLPAVIDIGPGSPTGVVSGQGAKFPAKYQRAVFINDWTYGTMWAVHLEPKGGSYAAVKEDFISGKPLPLTDLVIHPGDGAMYFAVGGRRTQSGLYRVTYTGGESTTPAEPLPKPAEFSIREELETLHKDGIDPSEALTIAWSRLSHPDRYIRHAARVAIERLPLDLWKEKALAETHPDASIEAIIALARVAGIEPKFAEPRPEPKPTSSEAIGKVAPENVELQQRMLKSLGELESAALSTSQQLAAIRALQLILIRLGKPDAETCRKMAERIEANYPAEDPYVNRELCQVLVAIDSAQVVAKTLPLLQTTGDDFQEVGSDVVLSRNDGYANAARAAAGSRPNAQQIAYMFALRNATAGWTPELRKTYFSWFPKAKGWRGGNSFKGFIDNIRKDALATFVPAEERPQMEALSTNSEAATMANFVAPKGPGRAWTVDEVVALTSNGLSGRDFANGQAMYQSIMCAICHRFNGEGGSIGPDLTGSGNRYTMRDLVENIIDPSKVISDQYDSHEITKKDGSSILGRISVEENGKVFVMANPFAPSDQIVINEADIAKKETRKISMMPPGLINSLNQDELLNLLAYLMSGGNEKDKAFAK
jgi:putative heme-binding domain-containing protein